MSLLLLALFRKDWPIAVFMTVLLAIWCFGDHYGEKHIQRQFDAYIAAQNRATAQKQASYTAAAHTMANQLQLLQTHNNITEAQLHAEITKNAYKCRLPASGLHDYNAAGD